MTLILLDEMNLAHVELYFSDFLSKLESRRGQGKKQVPQIDVKLGAGIEPYKLPLGRNVLWAGTMNQDETTKSLSDKVLDRGIEIHFPRPANLKRRQKLTPLTKIVEDPMLLRYSDWSKWRKMESEFSSKEIKPFMNFVEQMNHSLSNAGRALGHRVWQSIEYYMANYPDVQAAKLEQDEKMLKEAMHTSFEDQLVQKVMPKLRGIETRGKSRTECLDKIKQQLVDGEYSIIDDFDFACEFGYGQFMGIVQSI
jgi:GTPase subunit of restriction endonuclease